MYTGPLYHCQVVDLFPLASQGHATEEQHCHVLHDEQDQVPVHRGQLHVGGVWQVETTQEVCRPDPSTRPH